MRHTSYNYTPKLTEYVDIKTVKCVDVVEGIFCLKYEISYNEEVCARCETAKRVDLEFVHCWTNNNHVPDRPRRVFRNVADG